MPKKLTLIGALMALVLGAVGIMRDGNAAFAAPVQNFDVDATICYGSEPVDGTFNCPGATGTTATTGSGAVQWTLIDLPTGSRLTLPIVYTPTDFGFAPGAVNDVVGNVTSATDLLCDGGGATDDILAGGTNPGDPAPDPDPGHLPTSPWPDTTMWPPYDFIHQGTSPAGADAYVSQIKPMPASFTPSSYDKALLYTLWLGRTTELFLPTVQGAPTPLNLVTEDVPSAYTGGTTKLRVSSTLLAGNPGTPPNNSFLLCLDSPQNSVSMNNQGTTPGTAGRYARFTAFTSDLDERDGAVSRILDLNCVVVGSPGGSDADNDCMTDGSPGDVPAAADADGDFVQDGIEALFATDPNDADSDNDGATDFDEIFQFTNPHLTDTDGDTQLDKADNGADEVPGTVTVQDDTTADDNCPSDNNGSQANADSAPDPNGVSGDPTNPSQDLLGDACDTDDDNDGIVDVAEAALLINVAPNFCSGSAGVANDTDSLDADTDDDLGLDGLECKFGANPNDQTSKMPNQPGDNLGNAVTAPDAQETFYRTGRINKPGGGQEDNPDGDGFTDPVADNDSDNDRLTDGNEVKFFGTHPANADTDNDGCSDGSEAASVNSDRKVSSIDLSQIAQRFRTGGYDPAAEPNIPNYDYNKDAKVSSIDLSQVAQQFLDCPAATGLTITRGNAGPLN